MVVLAIVGAAVLAMVSWVALREAQRLPRSLPAGGRPHAHAHHDARPASAPDPAVNGHPVLAASRRQVVGDATVADADTDEALAAAAALWHVLVDAEQN